MVGIILLIIYGTICQLMVQGLPSSLGLLFIAAGAIGNGNAHGGDTTAGSLTVVIVEDAADFIKDGVDSRLLWAVESWKTMADRVMYVFICSDETQYQQVEERLANVHQATNVNEIGIFTVLSSCTKGPLFCYGVPSWIYMPLSLDLSLVGFDQNSNHPTFKPEDRLILMDTSLRPVSLHSRDDIMSDSLSTSGSPTFCSLDFDTRMPLHIPLKAFHHGDSAAFDSPGVTTSKCALGDMQSGCTLVPPCWSLGGDHSGLVDIFTFSEEDDISFVELHLRELANVVTSFVVIEFSSRESMSALQLLLEDLQPNLRRKVVHHQVDDEPGREQYLAAFISAVVAHVQSTDLLIFSEAAQFLSEGFLIDVLSSSWSSENSTFCTSMPSYAGSLALEIEAHPGILVATPAVEFLNRPMEHYSKVLHLKAEGSCHRHALRDQGWNCMHCKAQKRTADVSFPTRTFGPVVGCQMRSQRTIFLSYFRSLIGPDANPGSICVECRLSAPLSARTSEYAGVQNSVLGTNLVASYLESLSSPRLCLQGSTPGRSGDHLHSLIDRSSSSLSSMCLSGEACNYLPLPPPPKLLQHALDPMSGDFDVIILVISSSGAAYDQFRHLWRSYMHNNPRVRSFFIQGRACPEILARSDDELLQSASNDGVAKLIGYDVLQSTSCESLIPGILDKTMEAFRWLERASQLQFKLVFRTNLSSIVLLEQMLSFARSLPSSAVYAGAASLLPSAKAFIGGSGFFLSGDIVENLLVHGAKLSRGIIDDVAIGELLGPRDPPSLQFLSPLPGGPDDAYFAEVFAHRCEKNITWINYQKRIDIDGVSGWTSYDQGKLQELIQGLPTIAFHFRIKLEHFGRTIVSWGRQDDAATMSEILRHFSQ